MRKYTNCICLIQGGSENNDSGPESFSSPSESHDGAMDVEENGNQETADDADSDTLKVNPNKWTVCFYKLLLNHLNYYFILKWGGL